MGRVKRKALRGSGAGAGSSGEALPPPGKEGMVDRCGTGMQLSREGPGDSHPTSALQSPDLEVREALMQLIWVRKNKLAQTGKVKIFLAT